MIEIKLNGDIMKKISPIIIISFFFLNAILVLGINFNVESKSIEGLGNPNDQDARIIELNGEGETLIDGTTYFENR